MLAIVVTAVLAIAGGLVARRILFRRTHERFDTYHGPEWRPKPKP